MLDNVVFFLKPKDQVQLLYGMMSIQQGLDACKKLTIRLCQLLTRKGST